MDTHLDTEILTSFPPTIHNCGTYVCAQSVLLWLSFFIFVIFSCVCLCACMHTGVQVSSEARRERHMLWGWSWRQLWVTWWVLETELKSLNCWTIISSLLVVNEYPLLHTQPCLHTGSSHSLVDLLGVSEHSADEPVLQPGRPSLSSPCVAASYVYNTGEVSSSFP